MGASLFAAFAYWLGASSCLFVAGLVLGCDMSVISILCVMGYQLVPLCGIQAITLIFYAITYGSPSNLLFYLLYLTFGLSASLNLGSSFYLKTTSSPLMGNTTGATVVKKTNGLIMLALSVFVHMTYMLWVSSVFQADAAGLDHAR